MGLQIKFEMLDKMVTGIISKPIWKFDTDFAENEPKDAEEVAWVENNNDKLKSL